MKAKDLKNSILQMAVEGKLVPQDSSDEPASILLDRIREEKHRLIAEGKAKFPKGGESVIYIGSDGSPYEKRVNAKGHVLSDKRITDEVPFEELPEGWGLIRLDEIGDWKAGATPAKSKPEYHINGTVPWLLTGDLNDGIIDDIPNSITELALKECSVRLNPVGSVLVAMYGATIGKIGVLGIPATTNQACCACVLYDAALREWLVAWLQSYKPQFAKLGMGGAQPNISRRTIVSRILPIPPLAEQRRIIERVNELMPLVEEYGGLEDAREALDAALPGRLRKSVLQMAVRGGLVPQDPADEPAGILLERIRGQRRQLVAEGKMKAPKGGESIIFAGSDGRRYEKRVDARGRESEPVCIEDELPFEIPEGWEWARLGSVFTKMGSGSTPAGGRKVYQDEGPMLIRSQNVRNEGLRLDDVAHFAYSLFAKRGSHVLPNDMLLNITGASIGRCAIVPDTFGDADVNQHVLIMRPVLPIASEYLHAAIISPLVQSAIMVGQVGATKEGLSASKASELLVPFPPLIEQHRIVDVVDRLFKLLA